jgi:excisionase family DNA binding protein
MRTRGGKGNSGVVYSIRELADLTGMEKRAMARMLQTNGVPFGRTGKKRLVFLSDLNATFPELVDSMKYGDGE